MCDDVSRIEQKSVAVWFGGAAGQESIVPPKRGAVHDDSTRRDDHKAKKFGSSVFDQWNVQQLWNSSVVFRSGQQFTIGLAVGRVQLRRQKQLPFSRPRFRS